MRDQILASIPAPLLASDRWPRHRAKHGNRSYQAIFESIHAANLWGNPESVSGDGSTVEATTLLRGDLAQWLNTHPIDRFVDMPCGDFNWMQHVVFPDSVQYSGFDIVEPIVAANQTQYGNFRRSFAVADILTSELPAADVYFCKDLFIHFPNNAMAEAIGRARQQCRFFMATSFSGLAANAEIPFGFARPVNLELVLGPPEAKLRDPCGGFENRFIGIWPGAAA